MLECLLPGTGYAIVIINFILRMSSLGVGREYNGYAWGIKDPKINPHSHHNAEVNNSPVWKYSYLCFSFIFINRRDKVHF